MYGSCDEFNGVVDEALRIEQPRRHDHVQIGQAFQQKDREMEEPRYRQGTYIAGEAAIENRVGKTHRQNGEVDK